MGVLAHPRWGQPLEQYVLRYDRTSAFGRETLEDEIMFSARQCMQAIVAISKVEDEAELNLLASKISLEMLRSLLLLSSSGQGVFHLAQPPLVRGCIRLMKTIKLGDLVSPFSYEYGYLCFNIAKMALGVCLVEKFNSQYIVQLMERIWDTYQTKDSPSILTEYLSGLFLNEIARSPSRESRCDWIFGWSNPPVHGGHSKLIVTESDTLDLMDILWNDRKAFLKSLLSTYTPGVSIMILLIWQRMLRNGLHRNLAGRIPLLESYLDLTWRFTLAATPSDYDLIFSIASAAMFHYAKLAANAVDTADSRTIINAYIQGIPKTEDTLLYRHAAILIYPHLPRFIVCNILPGTEDLFPALIKTVLARMWEMVLWEDVHDRFPAVDIVISGFDDLLLFLQFHTPSSPVMQLVLQELAKQDLLGLIGFAIHRVDPTRKSNQIIMHYDPTSCTEFKEILFSMLIVLNRACTTCAIPYYFLDYQMEWVKHIQHNDMLLLMAADSPSAKSCAEFRRELLWDVIKKINPEDNIKMLVKGLPRLPCDYARCSVPSWAGHTLFWCSSCLNSSKRARYCSLRCQSLDWENGGNMSHRQLCPRSD